MQPKMPRDIKQTQQLYDFSASSSYRHSAPAFHNIIPRSRPSARLAKPNSYGSTRLACENSRFRANQPRKHCFSDNLSPQAYGLCDGRLRTWTSTSLTEESLFLSQNVDCCGFLKSGALCAPPDTIRDPNPQEWSDVCFPNGS